MYSVTLLGPYVETRLWPVISTFTLDRVEETETGVIVTARATKYRPCTFREISWFVVGDDGLATALPLKLLRSADDASSRTRPLGPQHLTPMQITGITVDDLAKRVFAEVRYDCHALWVVTARVYP